MLAATELRGELASAIGTLGWAVTEVSDAADLVERQPNQGWGALVVDLDAAEKPSLLIRRAKDLLGLPIFAIADSASSVVDGIDDFLLFPLRIEELELRLRRLVSDIPTSEVIRFKELELNMATYQATLAGDAVDLTYMEYELLRFFASNPGRVWSRAQILSMVWGYDYYGGSRTVDVHVRRLRAKLGEERRSWIETVRSVGYRFG